MLVMEPVSGVSCAGGVGMQGAPTVSGMTDGPTATEDTFSGGASWETFLQISQPRAACPQSSGDHGYPWLTKGTGLFWGKGGERKGEEY